MRILAILLSLIGGEEGTAVTGNPARPVTDEHRIKAVISTLEDALIEKDEVMVTAYLAEGISNRKVNEVKAEFAEHVESTQAPSGKPLVYLRPFDLEINGNKAEVKVEAFSYGDGKRIKAVHRMTFRRGHNGWFIDDAEPLNALLKQIGGIVPLQQPEAPEEKEVPKVEIAPVEPVEDNLDTDEPRVKVIPADAAPAQDAEEMPSVEPSEAETSPPAEPETTTDTEDSQ